MMVDRSEIPPLKVCAHLSDGDHLTIEK